MTIRHLKVFVTVCSTGSMSKAAKELFITQPTVSQAIAELEAHYGIRLFERLSRKLYITQAGEKLLAYARHIMASFEEMEHSIGESTGQIPLRIGATISVATCIMGGLLEEFSHNYPGINTQVYVDNTSVIEEMLLKSELDVAVVEGSVKSTALITQAVFSDKLCLVCSPRNALSGKKNIVIQDLQSQDFVLREKGSGTRELFEKELEERGITINEKWTCNNSEAIKNAVMASQGLTVISKMLVEEELKSRTLCLVKIKDVHLDRYFYIVYHENKFISKSMETFLQYLKRWSKTRAKEE